MKKETKIIVAASLVFAVGICIAYYNTASFGYDNKSLVTISSKSVQILDYNIEYKKINYIIKSVENSMPEKFMAI